MLEKDWEKTQANDAILRGISLYSQIHLEGLGKADRVRQEPEN